MWFALIAIITIIWLYLKHNYNYWKNQGVDTPKYYYFVGNLLEQVLFKKNGGVILQEYYKAFEGYNYFGLYNAMQPVIVIRNPDVINDILVKDFASFADNDFDIDEQTDPIFGRAPFILKGQRWKHVRAQSTPSFTSGKIKLMMPHVKETCIKLLEYLKERENIPIELDILNKRINAENVASCAFGLDGGSFIQEKAQFVEFANEPMQTTPMNGLKNLILLMCPSLSRVIKLSFYKKETVEYLHSIVEQTMKYRVENNIERNDFLDEMKRLRLKINDDKLFSFYDILGHAGAFLLDGVVTSSTTASYALYELAKHPDIQEKLREEIHQVLNNNMEELTYEKMQEMEYLDCVLNETMRQHPPLMFMTKRVTKPYTLGAMRDDNTGPRVELEVGTPVKISLLGLHMDEKYFPEPEKFDPDRFKPENKCKIPKNSFLPFGAGPRVCLGMRFALLQTKMTLITILYHYKLTLSAKTQEPLKIHPVSFINTAVGGYWVEFSKL